jgi:polysaccharide biosynthesis protein PslG
MPIHSHIVCSYLMLPSPIPGRSASLPLGKRRQVFAGAFLGLVAAVLLLGSSSVRADLRQDLHEISGLDSSLTIQKIMVVTYGTTLVSESSANLLFQGGTFAGHAVKQWSFDLPINGNPAFTSIRLNFPEGKNADGKWRSDVEFDEIHQLLIQAFGPGNESSDGLHRDTIWNLGSKVAVDPPQMILTYAWLGNNRRIELTCINPTPRQTITALPGGSTPFPDPSTFDGVGVALHVPEDYERQLDRMAEVGIRSVRPDFTWSKIERPQGVYDWSLNDKVAASMSAHGMRLIFILAYGNPLYEQGEDEHLAPTRAGSIDAYARWAGEAARHFAGRHVIWEIWNEPNGGWFWKPRPDADQYAALLLATCKSIREADPTATIIAPALFGFSWDYLYKIFDDGILAQIDGVSVHPYRSAPPETVTDDYSRLRAMIASCAPSGKRGIPVINDEWGYSTANGGVSREMQGDYLLRMVLCDVLDKVPITIWYEWIDGGTDPNDNFGILTSDRQWKPSLEALRTLLRELAGYRFTEREPVNSDDDYVLCFRDSQGRRKLVSWTTGQPHEVILTTKTIPRITMDLASRPQCWSVQ